MNLVEVLYASTLGLLTRLAMDNKRGKLTWKGAILNSCLAASSAFCVWYLLKEIHATDSTIYISGLIAARYGDAVMLLLFEEGTKWLMSMASNMKKIK